MAFFCSGSTSASTSLISAWVSAGVGSLNVRSRSVRISDSLRKRLEQAKELVATVGMRLAAPPHRDPVPLRLRRGDKPGLVHLAASAKTLLGKDARKRSFFNWQYSTDDGKTWSQLTDGLPNAYYYAVHGDGTTLYTMKSLNFGSQPFPETTEHRNGRVRPLENRLGFD